MGDVYNACHGENNGYDMSWPVDVKPKQEIEDCGNKVGKRLFTFCRSKAVAKSCGSDMLSMIIRGPCGWADDHGHFARSWLLQPYLRRTNSNSSI